MSADFIIRTFNPGDRASVAKLMAQLQDYEQQLHPNRTPGSLVADKHLAYLITIIHKQNGQIFVAESHQEIIGFIVCFVEELEAGDLHLLENERRYGFISDLYVAAKMRGQGVGATLMTMAEQHFLDLNLEVVRLSLLHNNQAAVNFYHEVGYQPYEFIYEKRL